MSEEKENASREDIHSTAVRAGKRTYFFDVKSTRGNDLYLTITESKRQYSNDGKFTYEKHKLFLYKEDFDKFSEGLNDTLAKIDDLRNSEARFQIEPQDNSATAEIASEANLAPKNGSSSDKFTNVDFEDLDDKD